MNILDLEIIYSELQEFLSGHYSKRAKQYKISDFISKVFQLQNPNTTEAYLSDLLPQYLEYISSLEPRGNDPKDLKILIGQLEQIKKIKFAETSTDLIDSNISSLTTKINLLNDWLYGVNPTKKSKVIYFPVLEKTESEYSYGFLESIEVEIKPGENRFHITPSESESDQELDKQIRICWQTALNICKKYIHRIKPSHTVFIHFVNKYGIYSGSSLGVALTLSFVEALLKHYNTPIVININSNIVFTGEIDGPGTIKRTDANIISEKVKTIFFSDIETFALPINSLSTAKAKYQELKKEYPDRKLELIGIESIDDLLTRRNLVDIRKQKLAVRTRKFVRKNWISVATIILFTMLFTYLSAFDFDGNPAFVADDGQLLLIKNKNGKILWTKKLSFNLNNTEYAGLNRMVYNFTDVNNDNKKELILCAEYFSSVTDSFDPGRIACYDYKGNLLWQYSFMDSVKTENKWQPTVYVSYLIGLNDENGGKILYAIAANTNFVSAVFKLDARNGKRLSRTLWNSGHFQDGLIGYFNGNQKREIVLSAINNGFEKCELVLMDLDNLNGQLPSTEKYQIEGMNRAKFNKMVLLPVTDYAKYINARFNITKHAGIKFENNKEFVVSTIEDININSQARLKYRFDTNLNFIDVECSDVLQVKRDSLIVQKKLTGPYTNTPEFENEIKSKIIYLNDNKFESKKDLK